MEMSRTKQKQKRLGEVQEYTEELHKKNLNDQKTTMVCSLS